MESPPPDDDRPPEADPQWLSTGEVARRLGVSVRTVYRFIDEGDLVGYRLGRVIRVRAADVDTFLEGCRIEPGTLEHLYPEIVTTDSEPSGT